ncbi:hypothetical protein AGMMS49928_10970 [Spirochaetia bacterium]|nr:hypothetical protein AGMMS49928_10970 [Spirochaetia bacterium]
MGETAYIRERIRSPVAGGWFYPEEPAAAAAALQSYGLIRGIGGKAQAILAPHGAWDLSGAVAGRAFRAAAGRERKWPSVHSGGQHDQGVSRVVLLGTIHGDSEEGLFLSESGAFETPFGYLPVDRKYSRALASSSPFFEFNDIPHLREHSLEILLPLVKYCFPSTRIIPILMGLSRPALISGLAWALQTVFEPLLESTLFVVSCNLSNCPDEETARFHAEECIRLLGEKDFPALITALKEKSISACGAPLAASLLGSGLMEGKTMKQVSGPLTKAGDEKGNTIYYGALAFI